MGRSKVIRRSMKILDKALWLLLVAVPQTATEMRVKVTSISRMTPCVSGHFMMSPSTRRGAAFMHCHSHHLPRSAKSSLRNFRLPGLHCSPIFHRRHNSANLLMSGTSNESSEVQTINVPQLKKEISRLSLRTHKKIGKVAVRIQATQQKLDELRAAIEENEVVDDALLEQLEQAPPENALTQHNNDLATLQTRLQQLNFLEEQFNNPPLKNKSNLTSQQLLTLTQMGEKILQYIQQLEITENESAKKKRIEEDAKNKKSKKEMSLQNQQKQQQSQGPRLPYRRYFTESNIEIKVGKQAADNDALSISPEYRIGSYWWYHASGCSGSHVVLCTDDPSPSEEDVKDAASLAALKSKCIGQSVIKVSMTRARNVSKPRGAPAGLVQLSGDVKTITLRKDEVVLRCERLEKTVMVN